MVESSQHTAERDVLAARLARTAERRNLLRLFADHCRWRFAADAAAVMLRDRRTGTWSVAARSGRGLGEADASLFEGAATRDPPHRLHRIARPLRPHGRLFGGTVVRRDSRPFRLADASRLGRLSRVATAELIARDRQLVERAVSRLHRKLAHGTGSVDALYHVLDEATRLTRASHSATILLAVDPGRWYVVAEKIAGRPSQRIGDIVEFARVDNGDVATSLTVSSTSRRGRSFQLVVRASSGDPFDDWDVRVLHALADPAAAAVDRLSPGHR